jgi:hypothetical protein
MPLWFCRTDADPEALQPLLRKAGMSLQMPEVICDHGAVAPSRWIAPRHNAAICQNGSKSRECGMNLLHILELS